MQCLQLAYGIKIEDAVIYAAWVRGGIRGTYQILNGEDLICFFVYCYCH